MRMKLLLTVLSLGVIFVSKAQNSLYFTESDQLYRDGLELFDRADYAAARNSFEKFIKQNSNNVKETDAKYYVALCALGLYHEDGEKLVENFIAQNPNHPKAILAYYELGNFHFKEKKFTKAIKYFEKVDLSLVTKEQRDETRYKLGYAHFSKRQFTEAQKYFSVLKREKSAYSDASSYYSGYIAYEEGKYDQAIVDLRRAEKNKAYAPVVPGMIANLYYKQGRYDELIEYSTKAARTSNKAKQKNFYLLTADAYLYKENYSKASEYYDLYAEQTKSINSDIRYRIGYAKYRLGSNEEAIDNLKRVASNRDSLGIYASYYLGILYLKEGNKLYALTAFEKSKDNKIDSKVREEGAYQYAKLSYDLNKTEQAINAFNYFLTEYDGSNYVDEVNDLLSEAYLNTNNYDLAIKHIEGQKNISRSLQNVYQKATYLRGTELFNDEKYEKAVDHFQKSLKYSNDLDYSSKARLWTAEAYSIGRKYEDAIGFYQQLIGNTSVRNTPIGVKARYGLGYAYYNTNQYDRALIQFKEYTNQLENASDKQYYNDALIRLADCYYVSKQYNNAVNFYQRAINSSKADTDYAHFQIATILGIDGKVSEANSEYDLIVKNYPRSRYVDDAMFYKAQLNFENGEYNAAISNFSELIRKKGSSRFVPYAYLSRASSYSNLKEYDKAVEDYNTILDKYLSHSVAGEALLPLQEVLNVQNKSSEFDAYLSEYRKANPNKKGLESVEFETAKNQFFSGEYDKTINSFSQYISSYPSNAKVEEAKYYMAESYYRKSEFDQGIPLYKELVTSLAFSRRNRVINRLGEIHFRQGKYEEAIGYYDQLSDVARTKKEQYYAWSGKMESFYLLGKYDSSDYYAEVILDRGIVNISAENRASLFLGKSAFARGSYETAKDEFISALNNARDQYGAEAQYLLGVILFQEKRYKESIETLIALNNNFNIYDEWVGKSYLMLVDNYVALEDYFQAKGTLNSVIENFPVEEIKDQARQKLLEIENQEIEVLDSINTEIDTLSEEFQIPDN